MHTQAKPKHGQKLSEKEKDIHIPIYTQICTITHTNTHTHTQTNAIEYVHIVGAEGNVGAAQVVGNVRGHSAPAGVCVCVCACVCV
jgi:hypothetical protein